MGLDVGALVAPLSDDAPSGPDLYGDAERQTIETSFERSVGDDAAAGVIDWSETIGRIVAQGEQTRDIWLPVYLMRAAAHDGDFAMLSDGAEWLARLLEERWEDVHPQLEELGFVGRKTPCESLTRIGDFLGPLQRVALLSHPRLGRFTIGDFIRFMDEGGAADNYGMFRALIDATPAEELAALAASIEALEGAIRRADFVLTSNADGDTSTNFTPTYEVMARLRKAVRGFVPVQAGSDSMVSSEDEGSAVAGHGGSAAAGGFTGAVNSRQDVERAIDGICSYYDRCEPGSPVPFILRRAKDWISLDFMAVLQDIAPGGLDEAARILKGPKVDNNIAGNDSSAVSSDSAPAAPKSTGW